MVSETFAQLCTCVDRQAMRNYLVVNRVELFPLFRVARSLLIYRSSSLVNNA